MAKSVSQPSLIFLRISSLSHLEYCSKRSKIESIYKPLIRSSMESKGSVAIGNRLHWQYSYPYKSFDRVLVRSRLSRYYIRDAFQKQIDNIVLRGKYDDLRIVRCIDKKYTSLIEVKTTTKRYLWSREVKSAIRQLQLYMWLLKEPLELIKFPLWKRSYLEIYSQKTGELVRRIPVEYDENIEQWIRDAVDIFRGLKRMDVPPYKYCLLCPKQVKNLCDWYKLRRLMV